MLWNNILLLLIAFAALIMGIVRALRRIARVRPPINAGEPLLSWTENPHLSFLRDPLISIMVSMESLAVFSLGVLLLQSVSRSVEWPLPGMYVDLQLRLLSFLIAGGSVGIVFSLFGSLVVIHARALIRRPTTISILPEGISYRLFVLPWNRFHRLQTDPVNGILRLYSHHSPDICSLEFHPPLPDTMQKADELIGRFLPSNRAPGYVPWYRRRMALIMGFVILTCAALVAGIGLARITAPWTWFLQVIVVWGFYYLSGRWINMFYSFSGLPVSK